MDDLTPLPPSSLPATRTTPTLSPGLKTLLEIEPSSERAIREIATVPVMRAEAVAALPALRARAMTPAGEVGVGRAIAARFQTYPQPVRTQAEWRAFWADYTEALEDVPEGAIEAAMREWVKSTSQFLPKPGELRQLALTTENRDARAYERARKAVEYEPPKTYEPHEVAVAPRIIRKEPTAGDRARVKQWAAEFLAQKPQQPVPEIRANHGSTDEHGITPELRAVLARQQDGRA